MVMIPQRIQKFVLILVPQPEHIESPSELRSAAISAKIACRIAHNLSFIPFSPLLHYLAFMSPAEFAMESGKLTERWLKRTDRVWLQFPNEEERLDSVSYQILNDNESNCKGRVPVYRLHPVGEEYAPIVMTRDDIGDLLILNFTAGVAKYCL